ncbi:MAG: altronate dehydratase [Kiritimatiellae bacterium]|nr:altronate dehydratase [Kiritimatiellia bacterium]
MIINPADNVEVRGDGHKYALRGIAAGENVVKYGMPIGRATRDIAAGEHVHVHNLRTGLDVRAEYRYEPSAVERPAPVEAPQFPAYRRPDGRIGVRNDIWVVPTVGCVNGLVRRLAASCGGFALTHPYGCSQLGGDHERTAGLLAALCRHPNAGGVLVVGLGCENNTLESFRCRIGDTAALNIRFMLAQDDGDEFETGRRLIGELEANRVTERTPASVSELVVGLKCGGSDGFSGMTANPLVGRFSDWLIARGGSTVLTEVPEMFGAEKLLMNRCRDEATFSRCVRMIEDFKDYYARHGQPCYENPSPGNKAGGISTLEDKSLGCVQKGGSSPVVDVLDYGAQVKEKGLTLLSGPGNDPVAVTALAAAGCHLVLFTTGRGTPFVGVVPTVKIASNTALARSKPHWIDWDAMARPEVDDFAAAVVSVAAGLPASNECAGDREIAIFKDGVTL